MTKPQPFRPIMIKVIVAIQRRWWTRCCAVVWFVCLVIGLVGPMAGWHWAAGVSGWANFLWWAGVGATASAQYYRVQPDADWSGSDNGVGHTMWRIGRWLAKVLPPLRDDDDREGLPEGDRPSG